MDYPRIAHAVATLVASGQCDFGIMVDGAGIGSAMVANKVPGVLAAACYSEALARNSREHNDANVLTLGAGQIDVETAKTIVYTFLSTACTAERHRARVQMIHEIEKGVAESSAAARPSGLPRPTSSGSPTGSSSSSPCTRKRAAAPRDHPAEQLAKLIDHTMLRPDATPRRHPEAVRGGAAVRFLLGVRESHLRRGRQGAAARHRREGVLRSSASRSAPSRPRSRRSRRAGRSARARRRSTW